MTSKIKKGLVGIALTGTFVAALYLSNYLENKNKPIYEVCETYQGWKTGSIGDQGAYLFAFDPLPKNERFEEKGYVDPKYLFEGSGRFRSQLEQGKNYCIKVRNNESTALKWDDYFWYDTIIEASENKDDLKFDSRLPK